MINIRLSKSFAFLGPKISKHGPVEYDLFLNILFFICEPNICLYYCVNLGAYVCLYIFLL